MVKLFSWIFKKKICGSIRAWHAFLLFFLLFLFLPSHPPSLCLSVLCSAGPLVKTGCVGRTSQRPSLLLPSLMHCLMSPRLLLFFLSTY